MEPLSFKTKTEYIEQLKMLEEKCSSNALLQCVRYFREILSEEVIEPREEKVIDYQMIEKILREIELGSLFYNELAQRAEPIIARYHMSRFSGLSAQEIIQLCREMKLLWKNMNYIIRQFPLPENFIENDTLFQQFQILESIRLHYQAVRKSQKKEKLKALVF